MRCHLLCVLFPLHFFFLFSLSHSAFIALSSFFFDSTAQHTHTPTQTHTVTAEKRYRPFCFLFLSLFLCCLTPPSIPLYLSVSLSIQLFLFFFVGSTGATCGTQDRVLGFFVFWFSSCDLSISCTRKS